MAGLLRSNIAVATGTAFSRATGLVRVAIFGAVLGKSALTDAYNQANATPNLIYELVIGGILSSALVPLFTKLRHGSSICTHRLLPRVSTSGFIARLVGRSPPSS